jgi:hypothetical protein
MCARKRTGRVVMWSPRAALRVQILVPVAAAAVVIAACGDDDDAPAAAQTSEGTPSASDGGARDAGFHSGNAAPADGAVMDASKPDAYDGGTGFDFDDFAIDEDAGPRTRDAALADACMGSDCDACHGEAGATMSCQSHWMCTFEREGGADGCNCGCGALDPDCAPKTGCSEPGCTAHGCVTCRARDGSPMSCSP